jgi:hypothetical protein
MLIVIPPILVHLPYAIVFGLGLRDVLPVQIYQSLLLRQLPVQVVLMGHLALMDLVGLLDLIVDGYVLSHYLVSMVVI